MHIDVYAPDAVIQGLIDGKAYVNRVAGSCVYCCPHCGHQVRFTWRNFYRADERSFLRREFRQVFDDKMAYDGHEERGFLDFHCPTCGTPTRLVFAIFDYTEIAYHFDIRTVLVGERLR